MEADFFCLLCSFLLLESHHKLRQGTKWISAWASSSMLCAPASFLSYAESLALSFRHLIRSKGGFLFCFFPKISASLPVKELGSSVPGFLFPNLHCCLAHAGTSFFAVTWEAGLRNRFGWKILHFFPPVLAVSCFPSLVQHTTWSYRLLEQESASGPGASFFLWHGQLCLLQELTELPSRRRDQYLQMADQYLQRADQSTSAPSLGALIKLGT